MSIAPTPVPWVEGRTIGQALHETAARFGDRDALVFPQTGYRASFAQFDRMVDDAARGLIAMGLKKGEHLAIWCTNRPEWVILQFATARIGVVLVTVNPANRAGELEHVLRQSDARALALIDRFKTSDYFEMFRQVCPEIATAEPGKLCSTKFPELRCVISLCEQAQPGMISWGAMLDRGQSVTPEELARRAALPEPLDPINIQYTSGTTGFPKGATLSHRNLLYNAYYIGEAQRFSERDRICIPVPFYHCFGCVLGIMCGVVHGAAMVMPHEYFDAEKTLNAIEKERCTAVYGVPMMYIAQIEHPTFPGRDLTSLRTGIMSGSPCPIELMKKVTRDMHVPEITIAYGQTEASPVITQTTVDDPIELRVETVGRPLPGVEVKIVDPYTRAELPPGLESEGELCTRGHVVMLGYYKNPEATKAAIDAEGWLHTGDIARMDLKGYCRITGRLKDMIIRGGENIYPREIEEFLYRHPAVAEVQVVGVPDLRHGEQVMACIKVRAGQQITEDEVRQYCRASLAHFKVPHYVQFVEDFPRTVTGKVQKYRIREKAIADLGLEEAAKIKMA